MAGQLVRLSTLAELQPLARFVNETVHTDQATYTLAVEERRAVVRRTIAGLHQTGQVLVLDDGRVGRAVRQGVDRRHLSTSDMVRLGDSQESDREGGDDRESHDGDGEDRCGMGVLRRWCGDKVMRN